MDSRKMLLLPAVLLIVQIACSAASYHDYAITNPEIVTIGNNYPGQEDTPPTNYYDGQVRPFLHCSDYIPPLAQQRQVIILNDRGSQNMDLLLLMLLASEKDSECSHHKHGCDCGCHHHHPHH